MASELRVWFILVDANKTPLIELSSVKMESGPDCCIANFKHIVHAQNPRILQQIDAPQLDVYSDMAALKADNPVAIDPAEEMTQYDSNMSNPLVVAAPDRDVWGNSHKKQRVDVDAVQVSETLSQPYQTQPVSYTLCREAFFNSIIDVTETDGWIPFGHRIPSTSLNTLYIRESYRTIALQIKPGINKTIITGTPGIGKSLFLIYLLWKLVNEGKRVLFIYHPYNIYYDGKGGVLWFASGHLPLDNDVSFWNETLWCLFDTKEKNDIGELPYDRCPFIVSTYPRRELLNDFKKPPCPDTFYIPLWTKAELATIAPCFPTAVDWEHRFAILGGIPRHVLEVTKDDPTTLLEEACKQCNLEDLLNYTPYF